MNSGGKEFNVRLCRIKRERTTVRKSVCYALPANLQYFF